MRAEQPGAKPLAPPRGEIGLKKDFSGEPGKQNPVSGKAGNALEIER
jgi:hypothetical protein